MATWEAASHHHAQVTIITFSDLGVLRDAHAADRGLRGDTDFVRELVGEIGDIADAMSAIVWIESGWELKCVVSTHDLKLLHELNL